MKRPLLLLVSVLISVLAVIGLAVYALTGSLDESLVIPGRETTFVIEPGTSFTAVSNALAARGMISRPRVLSVYASLTGKAGSVQAGEYRLKADMTIRDMLDAFLAGDVELHAFTIVEGWDTRELLAGMAANSAIRITVSDEDLLRFLSEIGAP
ncbi:MAG: endolytic transglycosylase MltG, partial [Woeseiaceae bacterium]|nr:endolytic transglycosylase MltG [Woeseiaceae bacterium]